MNEKLTGLTLTVACFLLKSVMSNTSSMNGMMGMNTPVAFERIVRALMQ